MNNDVLKTIESILLRCLLISFAIMFFWFGLYMFGGDLGYRVHKSFFDISREQFNMMNYYGMVFFKCLAYIFFIIPYIAVLLVRKKNS